LSTKLDYYHGNTGGDEGVDQTARRWMASPHNPMLDEHGRLWMTEPVRRPGVENNPKWSAGTVAMDADDPAAIDIAAKALASRNHGMQLGYYDTKTGKFVGVDTSYNTHHLQFDWQGRIWSDEDVLGMPDTSKLDLKRGRNRGRGAGLDARRHAEQESRSHNGLRRGHQPN
jgi:hypothetical protein